MRHLLLAKALAGTLPQSQTALVVAAEDSSDVHPGHSSPGPPSPGQSRPGRSSPGQ